MGDSAKLPISYQSVVHVEKESGAIWRLKGALPMKMTDFGISPPVGLFGLIRARDAMTVGFDLRLKN